MGLDIDQGFNWESSKKEGGWYNFLINSIPELAASGITHVWLPPPSQSVSPEGKPLSNSQVGINFTLRFIGLLC